MRGDGGGCGNVTERPSLDLTPMGGRWERLYDQNGGETVLVKSVFPPRSYLSDKQASKYLGAC